MPRRIHAVLVTFFNQGGELSAFQKALKLRDSDLSASGQHTAFENPEGSILAFDAGVGSIAAASSVASFARRPELDLSSAYWLFAGLAGGNPEHTSLGSLVWADWVVDGDLAFELDRRDLPEAYDANILPLGAREPYGETCFPEGSLGNFRQAVPLDKKLLNLVCGLGETLSLQDKPELCRLSEAYEATAAKQSPQVLCGGVLSGSRFWHGSHRNRWASDWVRHHTKASRFFASSMEDSAALHALWHLHPLGIVDASRACVLRAIGNYTLPPAGVPAIEHLLSPDGTPYFPGAELALGNMALMGTCALEAMLAASH